MYKARGRYWCPEGCWPAQYAKRFRELPWTYKVELTAPPGCFEGWWRSWPGLSLWEEFGRSVPAERPEWHPFAIWSLARNGDGPLHGHMVVGNLPRSEVARAVSSWPGISRVEPVTYAFGAIHYLMSQPPGASWPEKKRAHSADALSHCPSLILPPTEWPDPPFLDALRALLRFDRLSAARRRSKPRDAAWRSERARRAALARWSRRSN